MSIITVSRGTFSGGKEFAENLAEKLGYPCVSREEIAEEAIKHGVPVGKLQTAMVKPPRVARRLGPEREMYLSFATTLLCDHALKGNLVYHGHTGHRLLPGVPGIFSIRVLSDDEYRIESIERRLNLSRQKAIEYIRNVDIDRDKWVKFLYDVDWHDPSYYDMVINLAKINVANISTALIDMAEIPDFTLTPAAIRSIKNLRLINKARFLLASDERTSQADFRVTAGEKILHITCMPHQAEVAQYVEDVLAPLEDHPKINCTIAGSNILWLGEKFSRHTELFDNIVKISKKWDAAVELMKYSAEEKYETVPEENEMKRFKLSPSNGGIEEDVEEKDEKDSSGVSEVLDRLLKEGSAGGSSTVFGRKENLISKIGSKTNYSLIVLGDLFTGKSSEVKKRLSSDLKNYLTDSVKTPVASEEELKKRLASGAKVYLRMIFYFLIAAIIFTVVFINQELVLQFLSSEEYKSYRFLAIIMVVLVVPIFAFSYGSFTRQILKFLKLD